MPRQPLIFACLLLPLLVLTTTLTRAQAAELTVGYLGNGQGHVVGPAPTTFDQNSGKNVAWQVDLPAWGYGMPCPVGDRVFVLSEPGWQQNFPLMLCFDAKTGQELWRHEIDHLPQAGLAGAKLDEVRANTAKLWKNFSDAWTAVYEIKNDLATIEDWQTKGITFKKLKAGQKPRQPRDVQPPPPFNDRKAVKEYNQLQIRKPVWYDWGMALIGFAFPTPVSDGKHVYVVTGQGSHVCFDLDGKVQWFTWHPSKGKGDDCQIARSPLLYKDWLITDNGASLRVLDKKTGKIVKEHTGIPDHSFASPVLIEVGGEDFVLSVQGHVLRLKDLSHIRLEGWSNTGIFTPAVNDEDDLVYYSGIGEHCGWENKGKGRNPPVAMKLSWDGSTLKATQAWEFGQAKSSGPMLYHKGKLYCAGNIIDAKTGKKLNGKAPATKHIILTDGAHVWGLDTGKGKPTGTLMVTTMDGKEVGSSIWTSAEPAEAKKHQCRAKCGHDHWGFSNSCAFAIGGGRLFIRSYDALICIAPK